MKENIVIIRDTKTFYIEILWPKNIDENWKLEIESIIKCNEYLTENTIKNKN